MGPSLKDVMSINELGVWLNHTHSRISFQVLATALYIVISVLLKHSNKYKIDTSKWLVNVMPQTISQT